MHPSKPRNSLSNLHFINYSWNWKTELQHFEPIEENGVGFSEDTASERRDISTLECESTATNLATATLSSAAAAVRRRDATPTPAGSAGDTRSLTGPEGAEGVGEGDPEPELSSERAAQERKRHSSTCRRSFSCCSSRTARENRGAS